MYENEIKSLEAKFDSISSRLNTLRVEGSETTGTEFTTLNNQRAAIFEQLRILRRKQWDEEHDRVDFDDDR